jgi:hypothetical protein
VKKVNKKVKKRVEKRVWQSGDKMVKKRVEKRVKMVRIRVKGKVRWMMKNTTKIIYLTLSSNWNLLLMKMIKQKIERLWKTQLNLMSMLKDSEIDTDSENEDVDTYENED